MTVYDPHPLVLGKLTEEQSSGYSSIVHRPNYFGYRNTNTYQTLCKVQVHSFQTVKKQISFRYQKYSIQDVTQQIDRRKGATYKVSPYKLIINDGYYYLLAWSEHRADIVTFRLDRMKGVEILEDGRLDSDEFSCINMESYAQQHFGMFTGEKKQVSLRFTNNLLDTMVDRFGSGAGVYYRPDDERHFIVTVDVVADFQTFLDDIAGRYETE